MTTWYSFKSFKKLRYDSMDLMSEELLNVVSVSKGQKKKRNSKLIFLNLLFEEHRKLQTADFDLHNVTIYKTRKNVRRLRYCI